MEETILDENIWKFKKSIYGGEGKHLRVQKSQKGGRKNIRGVKKLILKNEPREIPGKKHLKKLKIQKRDKSQGESDRESVKCSDG